LSRIKARNFRSFRQVEVELNKLNVLIGANASGKSNFLDLLEFLSDIADLGLNSAVSAQGGFSELKNKFVTEDEMSLEVKFEDISPWSVFPPLMAEEDNQKNARFKMEEIEYSIDLKSAGASYDVENESIEIKLEAYVMDESNDDGEATRLDKSAKIMIERSENSYSVDIVSNEMEFEDEDEEEIFRAWGFIERLEELEFGKRETLLGSEKNVIMSPLIDKISRITCFDFDTEPVSPAKGKTELEEDGSNLALVLEEIGRDEKKRDKFNSYAKNLVPFAKDFEVEKGGDRSFFLKIKEKFTSTEGHNFAKPEMISDGTVNMFSLIAALFFTDKSKIIGIEEPEQNVHPSLLPKIARMLEEAADDKQIFVTTHNPSLVEELGPQDIMMIKRDKKGGSIVNRPEDEETVSNFLKEKIGLGDLMKDAVV
jgi:predicted ATPase